MTAQDQKYLLICNTSDGLVAQINGVIIQLQYARRNGLTPIVYLHGRSYMFGAPNPYYDADKGPNVWDYFYEPIGPSGEDLDRLIEQGRVYTLTTASELNLLFRWDSRSQFMNPYGYFRSVENKADGAYPTDWWDTQRRRALSFFEDETIKFNRPILDQVDTFVRDRFGENTLGLQLRGSDKFDFGVGPNLSRKVPPDEYFPHIDQYLSEHPECEKIFVATDQRQWLKILEEKYPGQILSFAEWSLSDSDENNFHLQQQKSTRGVEVVVDLLLLSRCDHIIKCHAGVGEMAMTLSPTVDFIDLNYHVQPFRAKATWAKPMLTVFILMLTSIWRTLSKNGWSLTKVVSVDGDEVIVDPGNPRSLNVKESHNDAGAKSPILSRRFVSDGITALLEKLGSWCFKYQAK